MIFKQKNMISLLNRRDELSVE